MKKTNKENKKKTPCSYPMNKFYNFIEDVPDGERVSNTNDCEKCTEPCEEMHCLIQE